MEIQHLENKMEVQETSPKGDHLSIEITNVDTLVSSIKQKLESVSLSHTISRVPEQLSKETQQLYNPTIVSIGPLHHDNKHCLKSMEDQKWRYFYTLLSRQTNSESTLQSCITSIRHSEQKARMFYGENIEKGSDQFVEMLLLDGCFIIELFLKYSIKNLRRRDDPFFSSNDTIFHLRCDLILYENQLPFFILDQLFNLVSIPKQTSLSLTGLALRFFSKLIPIVHSKCSHQQDLISKPLHFLDLIRQHYLPTYPESPSTLADTQTKQMQIQIQIRRAMDISALGIRIEKNFSESPSNIAFCNQKLKIPSLEIDTYTEILFRNLIAMELCQPKCSKQIASYVILMGQLIQSKRDVGLLQDKGILVQEHYTQWDIVLLFKRLFVEINMEDFYYRGICEKINGFQPRRRRAFWENMRNIYHGTHFGIVGFCLAALFLVFLFTGALFSGVALLLHHFQ